VAEALPLQKNKYIIATGTISSLMSGYFFQVLDVLQTLKSFHDEIG
jgi:hypothetical protein